MQDDETLIPNQVLMCNLLYLDGATLDSLPVVFPPADELEGSIEEEDGSTDLSTVNSVE